MCAEVNRLTDYLSAKTQESCSTYNMLKIARNLFQWTKELAYADYYEHALINGVLSIQKGREPGPMIYMLPLGTGVSREIVMPHSGAAMEQVALLLPRFGSTVSIAEFRSIESFSKLGNSIYFEEDGDHPTLYIVQFISSSFSWSSGRLTLTKKVQHVVPSDPNLCVSYKFSRMEGPGIQSTLNIRIPIWIDANRTTATLNNQKLIVPTPGNFKTVTKKWRSEDELLLDFPMKLRTETIKDDRPEFASLKAVLLGPYLLVGLSHGDSELYLGAEESLSDSITLIPDTYNSTLITLTRDFQQLFTTGNTLAMTRVGFYIVSEPDATFRWISKGKGDANDTSILGKTVSLEPFCFPGKVVMPQGLDKELLVGFKNSSDSGNVSNFPVVAGLDGTKFF
ncbi:uncharacterized protein LOC18439923 [Amborella trichopoda]|nr:uncharacterized protein LOC18439923 [Amborella trichopoda]|eukprot:XP_020526426.1 uncharacterized protein LOC18439923 [Amborella trichopoda]